VSSQQSKSTDATYSTFMRLRADCVEKVFVPLRSAGGAEHLPAKAAPRTPGLRRGHLREQNSEFYIRISVSGVFQHNRPYGDYAGSTSAPMSASTSAAISNDLTLAAWSWIMRR